MIVGSHHTEEYKNYMRKLGTGSNNSFFGKKHSPESLKKMSESHKKENLSEETIKKMCAASAGRRVTPETRKKISIANKGKLPWNAGKKSYPCSEETKRKIGNAQMGNKNHSFGKLPSEETRNKISMALRGIPRTIETRKRVSESHKGSKSYLWKGGITPENKRIRNSIEYRLWGESVFARDNWTCQKCGKRGNILNAHHIKNFSQYPELRFAIDNGVTLCKKCHILFHNKYGRSNNTKEQLDEFLTL